MDLFINFKRILKKRLPQFINFFWLLFFKVLETLPLRKNLGVIRVMIRQGFWKARLGALGESTNIYPNVVIYSPKDVKIGNDVHIAEFVHIWGGGLVEIGDHTIIAAHSIISSVTHDINAYIYGETLIKKTVRIGNRVWIGSGAIILPGVTIGSGAIIGAGAVVTKNVNPNTIVAGIPARTIRHLEPKSHL